MLRLLVFSFSLFLTLASQAQSDTIIFQLNGRAPNGVLENKPVEEVTNPFARFIGEWALKDDQWTQNWGGGTETIEIKGHHTVCRKINTDNSLLSIIDGPEPNGHIFWTYNPVTKTINHASSFGESRIGRGNGTINDRGDLSLTLTFEGEAPGTYRVYTYRWLSENEYEMTSVQMDQNDQPTGLHYGGNFVRIKPDQGEDTASVRQEILDHGQQIRMAFAASDLDRIRSLHHPEVTKALGYGDLKTGRAEVMAGLAETLRAYQLSFSENIVESILIRGNTAIEQSRFSIRGTPRGEGEPFVFRGRTMVTYVRYANSPTGWAAIREIIQPAG